MKKVFSISFAFLILLAGMHFSISTHYCGGKIASIQWSFSEKKANCGMEDMNTQGETAFSTSCCHNESSVLTVDNNYFASSFQIKEIAKNLIHVFVAPEKLFLSSNKSASSFYSDVNPPGNQLSSSVILSEICIFRI